MTEAEVFDFRKSRNIDSRMENRVEAWLSFFYAGASRLERILGVTPELSGSTIRRNTFGETMADWADSMTACSILYGERSVETLLVLQTASAKVIVNCMLGIPIADPEQSETDEETTGEETPTDGEDAERDAAETHVVPLTAVEQSMFQLFVGQVCGALAEAWPESNTPRIHAADILTDASRSRFVTKTADVVGIAFSIGLGGQSHDLQWLLPQELFIDLVGREGSAPSTATRKNLETLVRGVPVELVVNLGAAQLFLRDLADLKSGDLIMLDKKLGQPLEGVVGDRKRFSGWPARIGSEQVYQIESLTVERAQQGGHGRDH